MSDDLGATVAAALAEPIRDSLLVLLGGDTAATKKIIGDSYRVAYALSSHGINLDDQFPILGAALLIVLGQLPENQWRQHVERHIRLLRQSAKKRASPRVRH